MSSDTEIQKIKIPRREIENIVSTILEQKLSKLQFMSREQVQALVMAALRDLVKTLEEKGMLQMQETKSVTHKPEEFMPEMQKSFKCPDGNCGRIHPNPNFKKADTYCDDCGHAFGTVDQAKAADSCPECGSKNPAIRVVR